MIARRIHAVVVLALVAAACTAGAPGDGARPGPSPAPDGPAPIALATVADDDEGGYLDGARLALEQVNEEGGIAGRPLILEDAPTIEAATGAAAALVVGEGSRVEDSRDLLEEAGRPVFLLGGDLYSSRSLIRQVFQSSPPALWQHRVLARYAGRDREHARVALVHDRTVDGERARDAALEAFSRQGVDLDPATGVGEEGDGLRPALRGADALVVAGGRGLALSAIRAAAEMDAAPQLLLPSAALAADLPLGPPPGTVAPGPYTWAGWAEPVPRVRRFRERFRAAFGRPPAGAEQEGYDAVRVLAEALEQTGGRSGPRLVRALESLWPEGSTYSSLPVRLSPDDHIASPELQIGLFAVTDPAEVEPWVEGVPWRPLIRTFTYDGERTIFLERDRRVFFPSWREGRPSPKYPRAALGITTRPREDPLH